MCPPFVVCVKQDEDMGMQVKEVDQLQCRIDVDLLSRVPLALWQGAEVKPEELDPLVLVQKGADRCKLFASHVRVVGRQPPRKRET